MEKFEFLMTIDVQIGWEIKISKLLLKVSGDLVHYILSTLILLGN